MVLRIGGYAADPAEETRLERFATRVLQLCPELSALDAARAAIEQVEQAHDSAPEEAAAEYCRRLKAQ